MYKPYGWLIYWLFMYCSTFTGCIMVCFFLYFGHITIVLILVAITVFYLVFPFETLSVHNWNETNIKKNRKLRWKSVEYFKMVAMPLLHRPFHPQSTQRLKCVSLNVCGIVCSNIILVPCCSPFFCLFCDAVLHFNKLQWMFAIHQLKIENGCCMKTGRLPAPQQT